MSVASVVRVWGLWGGGEARSCQPPQELRLLLVRRLILRWTLAPPLGATKYGRFYPSSQLGPSPEHTLSSQLQRYRWARAGARSIQRVIPSPKSLVRGVLGRA